MPYGGCIGETGQAAEENVIAAVGSMREEFSDMGLVTVTDG